MNQIQAFDFRGNNVRTVEIDNEPYFIGKDVAEILGYKDTSDALKKHVDVDDKLTRRIADSGQGRQMYVINESGLYSLILSSKMSNAKEFKHWVTSEVLPSIRKHGAYMTPKTIEKALLNPDTIINLATRLKSEQEARKQLEQENAVMKPKAIFADVVAVSKNSIAIGTFAKVLKADGIDIGQNRFFQWLRDNGYLIARYGRSWNKPTQKAMDQGLFEMKANTFFHNSGEAETNYTPLLTGKGQVFFANKFKKMQEELQKA
ncbi:MAG: phage antirepressor [Liquorilactobacillus ghanensis]|jgi:anti-repressor protein|uniref:phage antirepressor KilAC domain-containing protein n=1 Tax=Liquorilactobacillus ghanensis TaxID=399370 RepID=UPI0039E80EFC